MLSAAFGVEPRRAGPVPLKRRHPLGVTSGEADVAAAAVAQMRPAPVRATRGDAAAAGRAQPHPSCRLHHSVRTQEPLLPNSRGTTFAQIPVDDSVNYVHTGVYTEAFVMSWTNNMRNKTKAKVTKKKQY